MSRNNQYVPDAEYSQTWGNNVDVHYSTGNVPTYDDTQWPDLNDDMNIDPSQEPAQENQAPHCAYCLCDIPECLVKCQKTGKYFCNGSGKSGISHIVYHLVKAHLKQIELPEQNPYSRVPLVCYVCGQSNIFNLNFVQSLAQGSFFVVCRECVNSPALQPYQLDIPKMQSLITDKSLLKWLVRPPSKTEAKTFFSKIKAQDMNLLEEKWTKNPNASILDLPQIKVEAKVPETRLQYLRESQYARVYLDLVKIEEEYDHQSTEATIIPNLNIDWSMGANGVWDASFNFPPTENLNLINSGDDIILSCAEENFNEQGTIISISTDDRIYSRFTFKSNPPRGKCSIRLVFKRLPYQRMKEALKTFANFKSKDDVKRGKGNHPYQTISPDISQIILGKIPKKIPIDESIRIKQNIHINGLPPLNESQIRAINIAASQSFSLIQGPPGTGKTTTIAALVAHLLDNKKSPILVCAPSNVAADHATFSIAQTNSKVVRVSSWNRDGIPSIVDQFNVTNLALQLDNEKSRKLKDLMQKKSLGDLTASEDGDYKDIRTALESEIIRNADVVVSTCITSSDSRLLHQKFPIVIVDEATQALEPHILIAAQHGTNKLILVGDHCQLGPVVRCKKAADAGLQISMVQRLVQLGMKPVRLLTQYRMHPILAEFPSNYFYEGTLLNGVSVRDRTPERAKFPWPNPECPMFFYTTNGQEQYSDSGSSIINQFEAVVASQIISKLCRAGVSPNQIGVITPYAGQKMYMKQLLPATGDLPPEFYRSITIASVDSFQGSEHDYIILSCVRSNKIGSIGFLKDPRRLNVAITRAKCGLIIIGSAKCLSANPLWHSLIKHFQDKNLLFEGKNIDHLTPARIILQMPDKQNEEEVIGVPKSDVGKNMIPEMIPAQDTDYNDANYF